MSDSPRYLLFAPQDSANLAEELGKADYSYWFVMDYFRQMLSPVADVHILSSPDEVVAGSPPDERRLLFMPPHRIPPAIAPHSIPVFAWEYDSIPTEPFAGDPRNDWRTVLSVTPGAIVHSEFAARTVREAMGDDYPVVSIPAPVWDKFAVLTGPPPPRTWNLRVQGAVIDSAVSGLARSVGPPAAPISTGTHDLAIEGVAYTSVVNPNDGRKNWEDALTAFVYAHRDNPDATLILKLVHFDATQAGTIVWGVLRRLGGFRCRVIVIHGFLPDDAFAALIRNTSYIVNSSRGEGQCLPLMEFMSAGVPAIAPDHTALAEYVTPDNAFPVRWTREWTHWPHDPRLALRCFTFPIDWQSLHDAYQRSYAVACDEPETYLSLRESATGTLRHHASRKRARAALDRFFATSQA